MNTKPICSFCERPIRSKTPFKDSQGFYLHRKCRDTEAAAFLRVQRERRR